MLKRIICSMLVIVSFFILVSCSVSYDFSDRYIVYEQAVGQAKTGALDFSWLNEAPAGKHGRVLTDGDGFKSVSYTNLDVYKRQMLFCQALTGLFSLLKNQGLD